MTEDQATGSTFVVGRVSGPRAEEIEVRFLVDTGAMYHPVILGEPGDVALLGVVTLEELGVMLDPFDRALQPMLMRL